MGRKEDALLAVDCVLGTLTQYVVEDVTGNATGDVAGLVDRLLAWEGRKRVGRSLSDATRP